MKLHLIKSAVFYLVILCTQSIGQNNLTIIDSLLVNLTDEVVESSEGRLQDRSIIINVAGLEPEVSGYLRLKLGNFLSKSSHKIFRNFPADSSFEGTVFEVQKFQTLINYSEPYEKKTFGNTVVHRDVRVILEGQIYNFKDHRVILPIKKEKKYTDEIEYKNINEVEISPYKFTYGKLADITFWQKVLEPVLVVSSVLVVLLLLFTQRS
jgi:hypothetical protein